MALLANRRGPLSRRGSHEEHDQIGSNSSTPPGAHTPRPDLVDKRLPSLINSYFGQVRASFLRPNSTSCPSKPIIPSTSTSTNTNTSTSTQEMNVRPQEKGGLPTAPASPTDGDAEGQDLPLPTPLERRVTSTQSLSSQPESSLPYPTPPTSSSSSMHRNSKGELTGDLGSPARTTISQDGKAEVDSSPQGLRRHTFAAASPLSSVVAANAPANHFSNPTSDISSKSFSSLLAVQLSHSRRPSTSLSNRESGGLTRGTSVPSSKQSTPAQTPPQTPRSRSHEGNASGAATPSGKSGNANGATIGPVLGKLSVAISEGRGLRSSVDPYVVCQFQCAEYISEGPTNGESDMQRDDGGLALPNVGAGGIPIQRTNSDRGGQSQAIPMRSRQSSRAGRDISSSWTEVTDPKWGHKAVL
jgi:hypothetical protein